MAEPGERMLHYLLVLGLGLVILAVGCGRNGDGVQLNGKPWGGLNVLTSGVPLDEAETVVLMLHGGGARGDDLVPLAEYIDAPSATAYVFPEGPLTYLDGRSWYGVGADSLEAARVLVLSLIEYIGEQNPHCSIVVGGFSQGAVLASNLLSEHMPRVSGVLIYSPQNRLLHDPRQGADVPRVLLSHGEADELIPISNALKLVERLRESGYEVTWSQFEGGHAIPESVLEETSRFLHDLRD